MKVTVSQLKRRLRDAMEDPEFEWEAFRLWFARVLMSVDDSYPELQDLAHNIHCAFSEAHAGNLSKDDLRSILMCCATEQLIEAGTNRYTYIGPAMVYQG